MTEIITGPKPRPALQAVLFDMDGLLVDTESLWFDVEARVMADLGCEFGPQHAEQVVGGPMERTVRYMLEVSDAGIAPDELETRLIGGMAEALRRGVELQPGAKELLAEAVAEDVPCALVSASHRILVDAVLDAVLDSAGPHPFAVIVTGDDVVHAKPHPEPYLLAATLLSVDPVRCVVLEDSPPGVAAAEAAGCVVVAVPSVAPIPVVDGRTVVSSLQEVDLVLLRGLVADRLATRASSRMSPISLPNRDL